MSLNTIAEDYFKNLNSISTRLYHDLEEVKSTYEDLWENIPQKEQQIILSDSVIKPELIIKYNPTEKKIEEDFAVKVIFEENCSYRDEHSGPFSFKTQSQRDLSILCNKKSEYFTENKIKLPVIKPKVPPPPPKVCSLMY